MPHLVAEGMGGDFSQLGTKEEVLNLVLGYIVGNGIGTDRLQCRYAPLAGQSAQHPTEVKHYIPYSFFYRHLYKNVCIILVKNVNASPYKLCIII